ncbi:N-acetyltransferase [Dasania sp. GY-MA-18]|uniref:GNAT family N-acetyltransferase n=1 Tax=Dasania phycosphaerae TaxID=2950436 RepID=A0A9J6RLQ0_9GAMM|nr:MULTISPECIES: GNAT family N-acetyltransferase [Dasania]MCR8922698.1 N-acetyltransferase [Dasania sp. GY-MA-18]MCZ0865128.1 GNAT family N-acetyltransferase [Dasania phycosphaerae]MCZ0868854.1 GNAT family N-acetyltransferase [Dasania phycosphaerae]
MNQNAVGEKPFTIEHQSSAERFVIVVQGQEAVLEYRMLGAEQVEFTRTFVPESLRGLGLAEAIVRAGLAWAKEQAYTISSSCWYVSKFI